MNFLFSQISLLFQEHIYIFMPEHTIVKSIVIIYTYMNVTHWQSIHVDFKQENICSITFSQAIFFLKFKYNVAPPTQTFLEASINLK